MPRFDVVGVGSAACDFVTRLDRLPYPGEKLRTDSFLKEGGGSVANAIVTMTRLGLRTAFAGSLGEDEFGRFSLASLDREGIETRFVQVTAKTRSPVAFCISVPPERSVISIRPTTPTLDLESLDLEAFLDARFVHLDGRDAHSLPIAKAARARGVGVSVDLQELDASSDELLTLADVAVVSESFAREKFGNVQPEDAVRSIHRPQMQLAAVTYGADGCTAMASGEPFSVAAEVTDVIDSTGAGDAFHGALLVGLLAGQDADRALRFATHVAAISCRALGSRDGIPIRDELGDEWL